MSFASVIVPISPPLVIIGIDAGMPAMGLSVSDAVMVVTLPPVHCDNIGLTARWVL
jgi:hypothetical protein